MREAASRYNDFFPENSLACPYFVPREILNDGSWQHPARLPLGAGWSGSCCASGELVTPDETALRELCNLGNAHACSHLPQGRDWDAVRFSVARNGEEQITLCYVCELAHAPVEHGKIIFDRPTARWVNPPSDPRVQRLATCYVEAFRLRHDSSLIVAEGIGA